MTKIREADLVKNTVILSLGSYLPKLTTLITLPLLTGCLTKTEYGIYDLLTTLVALLLPAFTLQIQSAAFRFLIGCRDSEEEITYVVTNIFAFTIPISILCSLVTYMLLPWEDQQTNALVVVYFIVDIMSIAMGQITRGLGKNFIYALNAVIVSLVIMLGTCWALLFAHNGIKGVLIGMCISCVVSVFVQGYAININKYIRFNFISWKKIKQLLAYSWPMVPNGLSNWVLSLSDRMVITFFVGVEANAVYAVANKIPNLTKTFQGNFINAWSENATLNLESDDKSYYYSTVYNNVSRLVAGLVAGLIACTPVIFKLLIRGDYQDAYYQMPILYMGMYFSCMSSFIGGIYIAHKRTKSIGITTTLAAALNLIIDILAVKAIGIYAGSISTLMSYLFLYIYRCKDVQKFQPMGIYVKDMLKIMGPLICLCIINYLNLSILNVVNFIVGISFAVFWNKRLLLTLLSTVKNKLIKRQK